jgi:hypothetical protein
MQLGNQKRELSDNVRLRTVFGDLRPQRKDDEKWSANFFETNTGVAVVARGQGGQIRGLNHRGRRPSKIIMDDVEDKESVSTDEQRKKVRAWAYGDLIPALPALDPSATIIALGTMLHPDSLLSTLSNDPQWTVVKFGALDKRGHPLWAANMDERKLELKQQSYAMAGELPTFYLEYYNTARGDKTAAFRQEFFIFAQPEPADGELQVAVYCDPAISERASADEAVIMAVGMSKKGIIFALDGWSKRGAAPREIVDKFFEFSKSWKAVRHGIESQQYQAALIHLTREEMFRKKHYFEIEAVTHSAGSKKMERIKGILQPRFASGYVRLAKIFPELQVQLLDFPNAKHDDWPDCLAGAIALLDPYAAQAAGDKDLSEDEYPPLDEVVGGDFRSAP